MSNIFSVPLLFFALELTGAFLFTCSVKEGSLLSSHGQNVEGSRQGRAAEAKR